MRKVLLVIALLVGSIGVAAPADAHYDHWHQATCQGQWLLLYNWPSQWNGTQVIYWTSPSGEMPLNDPELHYYATQGYECGWMGALSVRPWIQQVCEFGYCGNGMIAWFAGGYTARHFDGPYAGYLAVYSH